MVSLDPVQQQYDMIKMPDRASREEHIHTEFKAIQPMAGQNHQDFLHKFELSSIMLTR